MSASFCWFWTSDKCCDQEQCICHPHQSHSLLHVRAGMPSVCRWAWGGGRRCNLSSATTSKQWASPHYHWRVLLDLDKSVTGPPAVPQSILWWHISAGMWGCSLPPKPKSRSFEHKMTASSALKHSPDLPLHCYSTIFEVCKASGGIAEIYAYMQQSFSYLQAIKRQKCVWVIQRWKRLS